MRTLGQVIDGLISRNQKESAHEAAPAESGQPVAQAPTGGENQGLGESESGSEVAPAAPKDELADVAAVGSEGPAAVHRQALSGGPPAAVSEAGMTVDSIGTMSLDAINKNWEQVQGILRR